MSRNLRTAIIATAGAAHIENFLSAVAACEGISPVAWADVSAVSGSPCEFPLPNAIRFESGSQLIEEFQPELLFVFLEPCDAPRWIHTALDAECDVICDKHPGASQTDIEELFSHAQRNGRRLVLAFPNRVHPAVEKARALIRSGALGQPLGSAMSVSADQTRLHDTVYQTSWRADAARAGGGILMAMGIHHIDLLLHLTGASVQSVAALTKNLGGAPVRIEDTAAVAIKLSDGTLATLQAGFYLESSYHWDLQLWMSGGWLRLRLLDAAPLTWQAYGDEEISNWASETSFGGTACFLQAAVNSIRLGREPTVTLAEGHNVLRTVFAAYHSAAHGCTVNLD